MVFHVRSVLDLLTKNASDSRLPMMSVTENSIRNFIKTRKIGCVGVQIRFNGSKQCNAAHIQKSWFKEEDLSKLDESKHKNV